MAGSSSSAEQPYGFNLSKLPNPPSLEIWVKEDDVAEKVFHGILKRVNIGLDTKVTCISLVDLEEARRCFPDVLDHPNILKAIELFGDVKEKRNMYVIVEDHVTKLKDFFKEKFDEFLSLNKEKDLSPIDKRNLWWKHVEKEFKNIFRDISCTMMYMFGNKQAVGGLEKASFVTDTGKGMLMPIESKQDDVAEAKKQDILDLKNIMLYIIRLADQNSLETECTLDGYDVPHELRSTILMMDDVQSEWNAVKPMFIEDGSLILDSPYYWNVDEKIKYIRQLRSAARYDEFSFKGLLRVMAQHKFDKKENLYATWVSKISAGTYMQIYNFKVPSAYIHEGDLIRYLGAIFKHYHQYSDKADKSAADIEGEVSGMFPGLYSYLSRYVWKHLCSLLQFKIVEEKLNPESASLEGMELFTKGLLSTSKLQL